MGIGRRQFLQICGEAFVAFAGASTAAVAQLDDLYVNRKFGLAFRRPSGWSFADVKQLGELATGQILASDDIELTPDMLEWIGQPFVVVGGNSGSQDKFAPSAHFFLVEDCPLFLELDRLMDELNRLMEGEAATSLDSPTTPPMLQRAHDDLAACSELYKGFETLDDPRALTLSGCPSATYTAEYLYEHVQLKSSVRVRATTIFTQHEKLIYLIRLGDSVSDGTFNFDSFVSSIAFV